MAMYMDVNERQKLIIHHPQMGYMKAIARETKNAMEGSALLQVLINHHRLPGISAIQINVNEWDVWDGDDLQVLKTITDLYLAPDIPEGR